MLANWHLNKILKLQKNFPIYRTITCKFSILQIMLNLAISSCTNLEFDPTVMILPYLSSQYLVLVDFNYR